MTSPSREAVARTLCVASGSDPNARHESRACDRSYDGVDTCTPTAINPLGKKVWHYGWRRFALRADAILAEHITPRDETIAALTAERDAARDELEALKLDVRLNERPVFSRREIIAQRDTAQADLAAANAEIEGLRIAFRMLADSGHGGAMQEARRWFSEGARGPVPWPGGALFERWAAENGIVRQGGHCARAALTSEDQHGN